MRLPALYLAVVALFGAAWLQSSPRSSVDRDVSVAPLYRTKSTTVLCETPFQLQKAIVAMRQDDGATIRDLRCTRPGAARRVRLISAPVTRYGPLLVDVGLGGAATASMWGYADQFQLDRD